MLHKPVIQMVHTPEEAQARGLDTAETLLIHCLADTLDADADTGNAGGPGTRAGRPSTRAGRR